MDAATPTSATISGPKGNWLLGNLPEYRQGRLAFLESLRQEYGSLAAYRLGPHKMLLVSEPDLIREILVDRNREFGKSFSTKMLSEFFGEGLLVSEGQKWLKDRRMIQPAFAQKQVEEYGAAMTQQTAEFIDEWQPGEERDALDIKGVANIAGHGHCGYGNMVR